MRSDLFRSRKGIHLKLTKEVHSGLRQRLFLRGLSMQEVFDELARLICVEDKRLEKILDEYVKRKLQEELDRLSRPGSHSKEKIGELDQDALYDLISSSAGDK